MPNPDWGQLKEKIKEYAGSIGIDKIGFTDAQSLFDHLPRLLRRRNKKYRYALDEGDPEKRVNPLLHMKDAKSIISVAVSYPCHDPAVHRNGEARGRFSFISRGKDYHAVVMDRLQKLKEFILSWAPQAKTVAMADKEEILEKAIAVRAGLGWFGKHTLLVTPEYGSWVCLGELITDIPFPPDQPFAGDCGRCRQCLEACPTKALDNDNNLDPDRCLGGLTQSKELFEPELRTLMGTTLYGCDICQVVCPHNKQVQPAAHHEFRHGYEEAYPLLSDLISMTNAEFKKRFGHTSGAWRGRTPVQRNAVIAAGNLKDTGSVPAIIDIMISDSRPVMRAVSAWALGKIGDMEGIKALRLALKNEEDPMVVKEIKRSLLEIDG